MIKSPHFPSVRYCCTPPSLLFSSTKGWSWMEKVKKKKNTTHLISWLLLIREKYIYICTSQLGANLHSEEKAVKHKYIKSNVEMRNLGTFMLIMVWKVLIYQHKTTVAVISVKYILWSNLLEKEAPIISFRGRSTRSDTAHGCILEE